MSNFTPPDIRSTLLIPMLSVPGAEDAWRVFLGRYWPRIVEWACRGGVGLDDAEQIASQVVLKLACGRALASFDRGRGSFRPWLRSVVRRATLDFRRKTKETPGGIGQGVGDDRLDLLLDPASIDGLAGDLDSRLSHDLSEADAVIERVRAKAKSSNSWEAYYRTAILGQDAVEVADDLGLSVHAVYMAKKRVGKKLEKEGRAALG